MELAKHQGLSAQIFRFFSRRDTAMTGARNMQNPVLKVTALSIDDAALLLSKSAGKPVTGDMIRYDIEAGAPVNADGTINLVHYAAWLVKELASGD